jgi:phosphonate transport system substrate-binding protein
MRDFSTGASRDGGAIGSERQTDTLPNNGWVVRYDVPPALAEEVGKTLVGLSANQYGQAMLERLGTTHFEPATDETYKPVRQYLKVFSETVRPIEY